MEIRDVLFAMFLVALPGLPARAPAATPADLILTGGTIHTGDPDHPTVEAIAIRAGRVDYVGSRDGVAPFRGGKTRMVDLGERSAYPGFVDARTSLYRQGLVRGYVDLTGTADFDEAVRRMARAVRQAPPNRWVIGWGWDQNEWVDREFPRSLPLEAISMGRPLALFNRGLTAAVLNTVALSQAGIDQAIPDPPGGRFLRYKGNPTGCLVDGALDELWKVIPRPTPAEIEGFYRDGADRAVQRGWTAVHEIGIGPDQSAVLLRLAAAGGRERLPLRLHGVVDGRTASMTAAFPGAPPKSRADSRIEIGGMRWLMDGDFSTRGAALDEPYFDEPWNSGSPVLGMEDLIESLRLALEAGWQPIFEASGEVGVATAMAALDSVLATLPPDRRESIHPRLLRGTMIPSAERERMARLGVDVTILPGRLPDAMAWIEDRLGLKRMDGVMAWRTLAETPIPLSFGTDAPAGPDDPVRLFHAAITRQGTSGRPRAGWYAAERLTRQEALAGLTGGASRVGRAASTGRSEDAPGTLAPGRPANITILSADIMTLPEAQILATRAVMTIVDGVVVWEQR